MRKRRLMAAMLAGTMVFSSVAYADVQEQKHQPVLAQYQIATNTNADVKKEIPSGEETPGDPGQGTPEQDDTCDDRCQVRVEDCGESIGVTVGKCFLDTFTCTQLFFGTFVNQYVGIHILCQFPGMGAHLRPR